MSGWVPMPAEVWPLVAERLPTPWEDEVAAFDLRWHVDQHESLPSRRELAARWGWTDGEVRTLLRHPARWWDALKGPAPTSREGLTQRDPLRPSVTHADPGTTSPARATLDDSRALTHADPGTPSTDPARPIDATRAIPRAVPLSPSPSPSQDTHTATPPAEPAGVSPPQLALVEQPTELDPTPKWARAHKGTPALVVLGGVVRSIEAIRQRPVDPHACGTDAKHVLSLWRALGQPPIGRLADEIDLVARWARDSDDPLAENDIRGTRSTGERWGADRSHNVSTICVHSRWSDRLDAARRWASGADPPGAYVRGAHPGVTEPTPEQADAARRAWFATDEAYNQWLAEDEAAK